MGACQWILILQQLVSITCDPNVNVFLYTDMTIKGLNEYA